MGEGPSTPGLSAFQEGLYPVIDNMRRLLGRLRPEQADRPNDLPEELRIPRHLAIIMDGNGRWAQARGLPRVAGHRAGVGAIRPMVEASQRLGIEVLTLYAFSTENWKRPADEVEALMQLLVEFLRREIDELHRNGVRIRPIGRLHELPELQQAELRRATEVTRNNTGLVLQIALNYGSRAELVDAVQALARQVAAGTLAPEAITPELIEANLYTTGLPDPDLIIRTGGEYRLSNYLLWQAAYSELWVTPAYWPDFREPQLMEALAVYTGRERRFGGVLEPAGPQK